MLGDQQVTNSSMLNMINKIVTPNDLLADIIIITYFIFYVA